MADFKQGDKVLYEKHLGHHRYQDIPAKVLHKTASGRYRIELEGGQQVTVAFYSLKRPVAVGENHAGQP